MFCGSRHFVSGFRLREARRFEGAIEIVASID